MKRLLFPAPPDARVSAALLLLRLVCGLAFVLHGSGKIQNPFHWMGPDSGMPSVLQALAALSEFGGGVAWLLGLVTPLASLGLACTMLTATGEMIQGGSPFIANATAPGSFELPLVFLCIALLLLVAGPGRCSVDAQLRKRFVR